MFDLKTASLNVRKAAAMRSVRSGKWIPIFDRDGKGPFFVPLFKVYNRNHPDGLELFDIDIKVAADFTWSEIFRHNKNR